ncbi:4317_t:CDS:2 [Entrophospora sp. SA101]|nr:7895_t:CDS:2 [Entrophospora sp. SA101]CAJ0641989.1 4317_t:CDS:2 [Entrophospora sp. SA101]CAJ0836891.1 9659_t:CDS:2 [Entrophospora sp. SA101]
MIKKVSKTFSNLGFPRSKSLSVIPSSSSTLTLPSSLLPSNNHSRKHSIAQSYGAPITLDRYLTNEGHRLVVSYLRLTQIQKDIQQGHLHKLTEKDIDSLLKSYKGVTTNVYETLNYQELNLSFPECKLLAMLLKFDNLLNIRHLKLSKNNLKGSSLKLILESLHNHSTVITLDLSFNNLTDSDAKNLAKLIKNNDKIKELYVSYNNIKSEGAKHIAKALKANKSIERFGIESNSLGAVGGKYIGDMLKDNNTLKYLHIGTNNLQLAGIKYICESLIINKSIVSLSLDSNNFLSAGANELAEALKANKNLTHLYISRNNISNEGLNYICEALLQNTTLIYLDLEFNNIGLGLSNENHIVPKAINLTSNPIGNKGCRLIFSGIHKNKTLESLLLSSCSIGPDGAKIINESLKSNNGLQNLSLHKNLQLGVDGHLLIADALNENTSLKGLQLDYNFDEWESVGNMIQQCLTRNHFLQQEKYNSACRILKASRIILNTKQNNNHQSSELMARKKKKNKLSQLPIEIKELIIAFLDSKNVLSELQIISIIKWSVRKDTLGSTMEDFLTKTLSAYYPLTSDVQLWPTEVIENDMINNRF